jgi:hypothetical protein
MVESCGCGSVDCVPAGHPSYDGFRITELWIVTLVDPVDDQEGIMYESSTGPLMATDRRRLEFLQRIVKRNNEAGEQALQIKHFREVVDVQS